MRATTLSAARGSSSANQSRIAVRSSFACGVKLTFKAEIAQNLRHRDHRLPILGLLQTLLDFGALPCVITAIRRITCLADFIAKGMMRLHAPYYAPNPHALQDGDSSASPPASAALKNRCPTALALAYRVRPPLCPPPHGAP